jgi:hypothetical protein
MLEALLGNGYLARCLALTCREPYAGTSSALITLANRTTVTPGPR